MVPKRTVTSSRSLVSVFEPAAVERAALPAWAFDSRRLTELAVEHAPRYRAAEPFPHVVFDGLLPDALLAELGANFPEPEHDGWMRLSYEDQQKLQWNDPDATPPAVDAFVAMMHSARFLAFLETLTGVSGLIGDPYLFHGGLHQTEPGGYLKVHTDQNFQPRLWLYRRVNIIVYLNPMWDPGWGGRLQLWDETMTKCVEEIEPTFNRMVIFDSPGSFHGYPDPMMAPPGVNRQSIALYYYTSPENPATPAADHERSHFIDVPPRWKRMLTDVTPPIVKRGVGRLRSRPR